MSSYLQRIRAALAAAVFAIAGALASVSVAPAAPSSGGDFYVRQTFDDVLNAKQMVFAHYVPNDQLQVSRDDYWPASSCLVHQLRYASAPADGGNQRRCAWPPILGGSASTWRVDNFAKEIRLAIAQGVNGFVLDIGSPSDWAPGGNLVAMLEAAASVDPRFKVVPMPDTGYRDITPTSIISMWTATAPGSATVWSHPSIYRWPATGQPQLSVLKPEAGGRYSVANWQTALDAMASNGTPVAWLPCFGSILDAPDYVMKIPQAVGVANFGSPGVPDQYYYASLARRQMSSVFPGKALMWGVTDQAWQIHSTNGATSALYEAVNTSAWRQAWNGVIAHLPKIPEIMIVTWNDHGESSAIQPSTDQFGNLNRGLYDLTGYYTKWWRTGAPPAITGDAIFYCYRKQTYAAAHAANGQSTRPTLLFGAPADHIEMIAFLTKPATLQITIGSHLYTQNGVAGLNTMGKAAYPSSQPPIPADATVVPLEAGVPVFSIVRGGVTALQLEGMRSYGDAQLPEDEGSSASASAWICSARPCRPAGVADAAYYSNDTTPLPP